MNILFWVLQVLLAGVFLVAGGMKLFAYEAYKAQAGKGVVSENMPAFIGVSEVAGGLGLVLPGVMGVMSFLTPIAALALALEMFLAIGYHVRLNEPFSKTVPAMVLLVLSLLVGIARI